jgi:hypothetical protein
LEIPIVMGTPGQVARAHRPTGGDTAGEAAPDVRFTLLAHRYRFLLVVELNRTFAVPLSYSDGGAGASDDNVIEDGDKNEASKGRKGSRGKANKKVAIRVGSEIHCDLTSPEWQEKLKNGKFDEREPLIRAVKGKGQRSSNRVLDATAGLGRDGVVLAANGLEVVMVERNPLLFVLLRDGIYHARRNTARPDLMALAGRVTVLNGDAVDVLDGRLDAGLDTLHPIVVYIDTFYPGKHGRSKEQLKHTTTNAQLAFARSSAEWAGVGVPVCCGLNCMLRVCFMPRNVGGGFSKSAPEAINADANAGDRRLGIERVVIKRPAHAEPLTSASLAWLTTLIRDSSEDGVGSGGRRSLPVRSLSSRDTHYYIVGET